MLGTPCLGVEPSSRECTLYPNRQACVLNRYASKEDEYRVCELLWILRWAYDQLTTKLRKQKPPWSSISTIRRCHLPNTSPLMQMMISMTSFTSLLVIRAKQNGGVAINGIESTQLHPYSSVCLALSHRCEACPVVLDCSRRTRLASLARH